MNKIYYTFKFWLKDKIGWLRIFNKAPSITVTGIFNFSDLKKIHVTGRVHVVINCKEEYSTTEYVPSIEFKLDKTSIVSIR